MHFIDGSYLNLRAFVEEQGGGSVTSGLQATPTRGWGYWIRIAQLYLLTQRGGGTIFLGPGRYVVADQELVIVPSVTLWFSPGAVIDPWLPHDARPRSEGALRPPAVMEIQGQIQAAPHMIFFPATSQAFLPAGEPPGRQRGEVVLTGELFEEVYVEWWGAGHRSSADETLDADAIESAIQAAWAHRWDRPVDGRALAALRVVMPGRYELSRSVRVQPFRDDRPHPDAVWIEGRAAGPGTSTIIAGPAFSLNPYLMYIDGAPAVRIERIAMNGRARAKGCLRIDKLGGTRAKGALEEVAPSLASRLSGCTFQDSRDNDLRISTADRVAGALRIAIEACWFLPACEQAALEFRPRAPAILAIDGCLFEGDAAAMLRMYAGSVDARGCRFHNRRRSSWISSLAAQEAEGRFAPSGGVDVVVGAEENLTCAFSATHCESLSWQFLYCPTTRTGQVDDCTLTAVVHRNESRTDRNHAVPASVVWAPSNDANLTLLGCQFVPAPLIDGDAPGRNAVVQVGNGFRGKIIDLGTLDRDRPVTVQRIGFPPGTETLVSLDR